MADEKPYLWIIDSERTPLAESLDAFDGWADIFYAAPGQAEPDWEQTPDAVFFSAELAGGPDGEAFGDLLRLTPSVPLLAVARLRSLATAVAFFRAGAADYLSLPLERDDARERVEAALEKASRLTVQDLLVEFEPVDGDPGEVSLTLRPSDASGVPEEDDILAGLDAASAVADAKEETAAAPFPAAEAEPSGGDDDEPVPVDGLPIPTLWEELPCGLLVFDSSGNLVFSNSLGLELFGYSSLNELEDALEGNRAAFSAYAANHHPLPDNQWPQVVALKSRTPRSAVVSIMKPDRRRLWLRIDCLPHVADGKINRLSMTLVNLTGELPPLTLPDSAPKPPPEKRGKSKPRGKRRK